MMKFPSSSLAADAVAGLSLVGLLLPEAVAYAAIANLAPQAGVMALFAGLLCYALIGSSRFAIVAATSSSAAVLAVASGSMANGDLALRASLCVALVFMTGVLFIVAAIAKLGRLTDFVARPVLHGFSFGLAFVIVCKQWAEVVGIHLPSGPILSALPSLLQPQWNWYAVSLAVAAFILLLLMRRLKHLPAGLIVVALGIALSFGIDLPHYKIGLIGQFSLNLPTWDLPQLQRSQWVQVSELALALVLLLYAESYSAIRAAAITHGDRITPNRDLFALGVANIVSAALHGLAVGAGFSATSANQAAGATSRLAGLIAAVLMAVIVITMLPLLARVPQPVLAAIVVDAIRQNLSLAQFKPYFQWRRDRLISVVAVLAVLILGVLDGLLAAVAVSVVLLLRQIAKSNLAELGRLGGSHDFVEINQYDKAQRVPGLLLLRPDEPLFFANAERIMSQARHRVRAAGPAVRHIVLSLEESADLDGSAVQALAEFEEFLRKRGQTLHFARLKEAALHVIRRSHQQPVPPQATLSVDQVVGYLLHLKPV